MINKKEIETKIQNLLTGVNFPCQLFSFLSYFP